MIVVSLLLQISITCISGRLNSIHTTTLRWVLWREGRIRCPAYRHDEVSCKVSISKSNSYRGGGESGSRQGNGVSGLAQARIV